MKDGVAQKITEIKARLAVVKALRTRYRMIAPCGDGGLMALHDAEEQFPDDIEFLLGLVDGTKQ